MSPPRRAPLRCALWLCAALAAWGGHARATPAAPAPAATATAPAAREEAPPWQDRSELEQESMGWALVRMMVVLGLVIALTYLTLNVGLRRLMGLAPGALRRASVVTVVERIPLDPKRVLFVVKAAGEYLLVGGSDGGMSLLSRLDTAEVQRIEREKAAPAATSPFLQKLLSRRGGSPPPSA